MFEVRLVCLAMSQQSASHFTVRYALAIEKPDPAILAVHAARPWLSPAPPQTDTLGASIERAAPLQSNRAHSHIQRQHQHWLHDYGHARTAPSLDNPAATLPAPTTPRLPLLTVPA